MSAAGNRFRNLLPLRRRADFTLLQGLGLLLMLLLSAAIPTIWAQGQMPSKEEAISRVEQLGGSVGIDGEHPEQPVWMVDFSGVEVDKTTLKLLKAFPKLESLHLDRTPVTDELLKQVGEFKTLTELSLADTRITDAGLANLTGLSLLQKLNLSGTKISNSGLLKLVSLQKLTEITYAETEITESGLDLFASGQQRYQPPTGDVREPTVSPSQPARESGKLADAAQQGRPQLAGSLHEIGRTLFTASLGNPERKRDAVAILEQALQADPTNEQIQLDLADAYVLLSRDETLALALNLYEAALAKHPGDDALLARIADAYGRLGNSDAAIAVAASRVKADGKTKTPFPAALQISDFAVQSQDLERGVSELQRIVRDQPQDAGVRLLLAALLLDTGQTEPAQSQIEKALQLLPPGAPLAQAARRLQERSRS